MISSLIRSRTVRAIAPSTPLRRLLGRAAPISTLSRPGAILSSATATPRGCQCGCGARAFSTTCQKIDGRGISQQVWKEVAEETNKLERPPGLAVVLVGGRGDSSSYVKLKHTAAEACGFHSVSETMPEDVSQDDLLAMVSKLNNDPDIDGVLVQLPLPDHIDQKVVLRSIDRHKDVDGFHPYNLGGLARRGEELRQVREKFIVNKSSNVPCTPLGCIELCDRYGVDLSGKHAVVLGRSNIVGLPMAMLLMHRNATVTVCHSRTKDIPAICREADVIIAAIGRPEMVRGDWVKPGAVVLDVGVNFVDAPERKSGKRMCGDVHWGEVSEVAGLLTPVPGGVGPMTVAMLMRNTLSNAQRNLKRMRGEAVSLENRKNPLWPPTSVDAP